jgi:hypothetical protein
MQRISRLGIVNAYIVPEDDGLTLIDTLLSGPTGARDASRTRSVVLSTGDGPNTSPSPSMGGTSCQLDRKIIGQPVPRRSADTSQPATIGPAIAVTPMTGPTAAKAPPISRGGKTALMT